MLYFGTQKTSYGKKTGNLRTDSPPETPLTPLSIQRTRYKHITVINIMLIFNFMTEKKINVKILRC